MLSSRTGLPRRPVGLGRSVLAGLAVLGLVASTGCQVEYAGMTLPSGKYMHDDVQYFAPGPDFPWANTQAATQRARMQAMGLEPKGTGPMVVPTPPGALNPAQNQFGRPTDISASPLPETPPPAPAPGTPPPPDAVPPPAA